MAYEPKTESAKKALADGADPAVVEQMEKDGELADSTEEAPENKGPKVPPADDKGQKGKGKGEDGGDGVEKGKTGDDSEDADDEEDVEEEETPPNRTATNMPVWKHKEEIKKAKDQAKAEAKAEFDQELSRLSHKEGGASDEDVSKFAEEFSLTPEVAGSMIDRLASIVEKRAGIPEFRKKEEERDERERQTKEEQGFQKEFDSQTTQEAIKAAAGNREITADVRKRLHDLAYSTTYATYRLPDIIQLEGSKLFPEASKPHKSAEAGRGGLSRGGAVKSVEEMSPEEMDNLSDDEFLKASNALASGQSRYTKITKKR